MSIGQQRLAEIAPDRKGVSKRKTKRLRQSMRPEREELAKCDERIFVAARIEKPDYRPRSEVFRAFCAPPAAFQALRRIRENSNFAGVGAEVEIERGLKIFQLVCRQNRAISPGFRRKNLTYTSPRFQIPLFPQNQRSGSSATQRRRFLGHETMLSRFFHI